MNKEPNNYLIQDPPEIIPKDIKPQKSFNFLEFIKKPLKSDEKKIELHDYLSTLNKENSPKEISLIENPQASFKNIEEINHISEEGKEFNFSEEQELKEFDPIDVQKAQPFEKEKKIFDNLKECNSIDDRKYKLAEEKNPFDSQNECDLINNQKSQPDEKEINLFDYQDEYNAVNVQKSQPEGNEINLLDVPCPEQFQIQKPIEQEVPEELKKDEEEKEGDDEEQEEEKSPIGEENSNQPKFIYGHALEDIIYNVNSLRGQLSQLKRVSEHAGIDSSYLQNIDQSFSMALNGIQQRFNDTRELLLHNENQLQENLQRNFPELSEEVLARMLEELQNPLNNFQKVESPRRCSSCFAYFRKIKKLFFTAISIFKSFGEKVYITLKNPDNLFKILVVLLSMVLYSGLRQVPVFEKYDGEFFDWLAYNKSAKNLLFVKFFEK